MIEKQCAICGKPMEVNEHFAKAEVTHYQCAFASLEEVRKVMPQSVNHLFQKKGSNK